MSRLGEEVSAPDGRMLRVVRLPAEVHANYARCTWCALYYTRLDQCAGSRHPFNCCDGGLKLDEVAVFVDDIPVLTMKGILS